MKFHHIGIACESITTMQAVLADQFKACPCSEVIYDPLQKASLQLFRMSDGILIEMVSGEAVSAYLRRKQALYHTCFEVTDLEDALIDFERQQALIVSPPKPAILFDQRRVAFVMTKLGLVELVEEVR